MVLYTRKHIFHFNDCPILFINSNRASMYYNRILALTLSQENSKNKGKK